MTDTLTDPNDDFDDDTADGVAIPQGDSPLEALRRKRRKIAAGGRTATFDVPGYDGLLVAKFEAADLETLKGLGKRVGKSRNPRAEIEAMADTLAWSCRGFSFVRSGGKREPLEITLGDDDAHPIRFDKRLGQALEFDRVPRTARDAVFLCIPDEVALTAFYTEVATWMQDLDAGSDEDDDEFVGE